MNENDTVLNGRYTLTECVVAMPDIQPSALWEAADSDGNTYTLKITPYTGTKPPPEIRRLWDNDLRVMYRLSSSAGADRQLVIMKDAGIDADTRVMILVYEGWQHITFAQILKNREATDWLSFKSLKERHSRRELWRALLQLAKGLKSLHDQNLIHRNVTPEAIWGHQGGGSESLRLSGFDWSARIGHVANIHDRSSWATPPELQQVGYSFASDWYGFGTTVARCFHKVEHLSNQNASLAEGLISAISRENPCSLEPLEKDFIKAIAAPNRLDRLQRATEILERIEKIIESLDFGQQGKGDDRRVLLHIDPKNSETTESARRAGFVVNPDDPFEGFDPDVSAHSVRLKEFIVGQLRNSKLSWSRGGAWFEVKGGSLFIRGNKWMDWSSREQSWKAAKANLSNTSRLPEPVPASGFDDVRIEVELMSHEVKKKIGPGSGFIPWDRFTPKQENFQGLGPDSENLQQFLHVSNQFEVLLRDAELFKYKIVHSAEKQGNTEITIGPIDENRPSRQFFKADKRMVDFIQQVMESGQRDCDKVLLTDSDSLFLKRAGVSVASAPFDVDREQWTVKDIDQENETLTLFRQNAQGIALPPQEGYLRTPGHYGQIRLIERRKQSIDRLSSHAFLLRTLATPGFTSIDAGASELPWPQIEEGGAVDENKLAAIKDILRMRPKYALQGPPGTGKSTLVAHLLRQILEDDPMAQILVTAKDHAAVDVLLEKVMKQAYKGTVKEQLPLAVRLNRRDGNDHAKEQARELMQTALDAIRKSALQDMAACADIQRVWRAILQTWNTHDQSESAQVLSNALVDLARRGASIIYCTTSSGDLEELAKGAHSFDWSIVEEAGKTHGFDLALPLQAGHRWLLLGDHKQLRPFLYDEFAACFNQLRGEGGTGGVIGILDELGRKPGNARLIDIEWLKEKLDADANWAKSFPNYAQRWLASFESIFEGRRKLKGITQNQSIGASVGLLTKQYRMPPVVGDLNSAVFYKGAVSNGTVDEQGVLLNDHRNPFVAPAWLSGKSLVWVDIPWDHEHKERKKTGYTNRSEQRVIQHLLRKMATEDSQITGQPYTVAILTPYNLQKMTINQDAEIKPPSGCEFGSAQNREAGESKAKAYSVDSFQGDEADVIIVSLVRNKPTRAQETLSASDIEFIAQPDRLNVMLSRPKRLLIIVGCWDFLSACVADVSSATDADGNYIDPDYGPFKKTIEELNAMFKGGRALKITAQEVLQ